MALLKLDRDAVIAAGLRFLPVFDKIIMRFAATDEHQVFPNELFSRAEISDAKQISCVWAASSRFA